jgi:hypothetical protein
MIGANEKMRRENEGIQLVKERLQKANEMI